MLITLIIPARNEAEALPLLIPRIPSIVDEIIVVDNGSQDKTGQIAQSLGCRVIYEPTAGYGAAVWSGLQNATGETIIFASADGSDPIENINQLLRPLIEEEVDFVFAKRQAQPAAMSSIQKIGNRIASALIYWRWGVDFGDLGPFRALRRQTLMDLNMKDRGFGWTLEMQAKIAARGYKWQSIALPYAPRSAGKSKISGTFVGTLRASGAIIWTFLILALKRHI